MNRPPVKVGIIGLGFAGSVLHAPPLSKNAKAEIVAVADTSADKLAEFRKAFPHLKVKATTDALEVIHDDNVEAVIIATPTNTHCDLSIAALQAGKHVLCEKPVSNTLADAERMVQVALEHEPNQILMIGQVLRFWTDYVEIKKMIERGTLGEPVIARAYRANPMPASEFYEKDELSGGVIIDLGLHDLDFCVWALGKVRSIYAQGGNFSGRGKPELIDYAQIHLNFVSGAIAYIETNWALPDTHPFSTAFELVGTEGMLSTDNSESSATLAITCRGEPRSAETVSGENAYYMEQDAFLNAILERLPSPVPAREALDVLRLAMAAKESIRTGDEIIFNDAKIANEVMN